MFMNINLPKVCRKAYFWYFIRLWGRNKGISPYCSLLYKTVNCFLYKNFTKVTFMH